MGQTMEGPNVYTFVGLIAIKMPICMRSQHKNLIYALWQEVPKLLYAFWTCHPVYWVQGSHLINRAIQKKLSKKGNMEFIL